MYKYFLTLVISLLAFLPPGALAEEIYYPDTNCLKIQYPNGWFNGNQYSNPDSVKIDSCENSQTYLRKYSRQGFLVYLDVYPFTPKPISFTDRKTWRDMDSQDVTLRNGFELLEEKYGSFTFKRRDSDDDSIALSIPTFYLDFNKDQLIDSVIFGIKNIDGVIGYKRPYAAIVLDVPENEYYLTENISLSPNPSGENLKVRIPNGDYTSRIELSVYDILGNSVMAYSTETKSEINLDIHELEPGFYFLHINNQIIKFLKTIN